MNGPAYCRPEAFDAFSDHLRRDDLAGAAAAIALHALPDESIEATTGVYDQLAATVRRRVQSDSDQARLAHLHDVLFDVAGFRGAEAEDYYAPENSYLPLVVRRRRGIPITLVLVYREVARRLGLEVEGVNAPGHFLASVTTREAGALRQAYVDPFYGGGLLTLREACQRIRQATGQPHEPDPALLRPATLRAWLRRMLLNLQAVFTRAGAQRDVYAMLELEAVLSEMDR